MSYYFAMIGTKDNPLFEYEFGTSKSGGDGQSRFSQEQRRLNQFVVHASLDLVEEYQWTGGQMYLKHIDRFGPSHIHGFITGGNVKFLLLTDPTASIHNPASSSQSSAPYNPAQRSSAASSRSSSYAGSPAASYNPNAPSTEEAVKNFMIEVYDNFVKTMMNPFYDQDAPVTSPIFRTRVAAAGKKYL